LSECGFYRYVLRANHFLGGHRKERTGFTVASFTISITSRV
jgi:hypothetical protein